jgi:alpha-tubulin suppressor-like RCC1 family protein
MKAMRRSRRLARRASCGVLILGLATGAVAGGAGAARAQTAIRGFTPAAVSWGDNFFGELGNGAGFGSALPGGVSGMGSGVSQVAAGRTFALALKSDGTVWAWGDNENGQLGDDTGFSSGVPVQVKGLSGVTRVAAGDSTGYALRSDGTVWAWGLNSFGQLGNGTVTRSFKPVRVSGLHGITQIAAGDYFALALRSDGTVRAWGDDQDGELGNGTQGQTDFSKVAIQVSGLSRVTMIAAGGVNAMATRIRSPFSILTTVMTWGPNQDGQLGVSLDTPFALTPVAVTAIGAGSVRGISMGSAGTAMALFTDGSLWEWGHNIDGDIPGAQGNAVPTPRETMAPGSGITQVSAGFSHVLALRSNETVLAWGDNGAGELGDGTTTAAAGPVEVSGLTNTIQVVAGWSYSLALHMVNSIIIFRLTR